MNEAQVIQLINDYIKANGNNEITGNILNGVLLAMVGQINDKVGDLDDLATPDNDTIVEAINWIMTQLNGGAAIHTGMDNPNVTPPDSYAVGDLYSQVDIIESPLYLYQFTGTEWARISNYINDDLISLDTTWSSAKLDEAIKGDRLNGVPTIILDGNEITISGLTWYIQGNAYILIPPFNDTINYTSSAGMSRKDIVITGTGNNLVRIQGVEGTGVVVAPQIPPGTLLVTELDVYHDSIGEPTEPILGDVYIKKSSEAFTQIVPTTAEIKLNIDNNRNFVVNAPDEVTIVGVVKTTSNGSTSTDTNWSGSDLYIYRKIGSNNVKIKHHSISDWTAAGYTLYFPDEQDYDVEEGEMLHFKIMQWGTFITNDPIMAFPIYLFVGSSKGGSGGSVSSVDMSVPTGFTISGNPITTSGTLAFGYDTGYQGFTTSESSKLSGIEAGADVTDATNVSAAGAVMTTGNQTVGGIKTFSSIPILPASNPTTDNQSARKKYVDDGLATKLGEAPEDGKTYGRKDGDWEEVETEVTDGDKGDIVVSDTGASWSVHKLINVAQVGETVVPTVLPDGSLNPESIMDLFVYDDTITPYSLANLQSLYPTSGGALQGFEVRCRLLSPPTTYRKESENDSLWIKIEGSNVT